VGENHPGIICVKLFKVLLSGGRGADHLR